jgi:hypothetical protein
MQELSRCSSIILVGSETKTEGFCLLLGEHYSTPHSRIRVQGLYLCTYVQWHGRTDVRS